jgi:hypothetical protein
LESISIVPLDKAMKLYTPEKSILLDVTSVQSHPDGVLVMGKIMGTMPMKAIVRPEELRAGIRLLTVGVFFTLIAMLFRPAKRA